MFGDNNQNQTNNGHASGAPAHTPFDPSILGDGPALPGYVPDPPTPATTQPQQKDDLLNIKQEALQQLTPLVSHLDQSPEEKFRTTMMMIQASDDQSLLKTAYESAKQISDEKARAQALLDVVNEINYFTQHHNS